MNLVKNIKNTAINTLLNEAAAIKKLVDYINDDFENSCASDLILYSSRINRLQTKCLLFLENYKDEIGIKKKFNVNRDL